MITNHRWRWCDNPPPEHVMQDGEALLRYELSLIHRAYREECAPIVEELCKLEAMKPPKPMIISFDDLTPEPQERVRQMAERIKS